MIFIISLEDKEIEDVFPIELYFETLSEIIEFEELTYENFISWWDSLVENDRRKNCKLISKRIGWWLFENGIYDFNKPEAFQKNS